MSDDNDDGYLLHPHDDVLHQEFPDLWFEISAAFDGEPPAAIGDRIDGICNRVIAYQPELVDVIRRRDEEIAELQMKITGEME